MTETENNRLPDKAGYEKVQEWGNSFYDAELDDIPVADTYRLVIVGETGTGKTRSLKDMLFAREMAMRNEFTFWDPDAKNRDGSKGRDRKVNETEREYIRCLEDRDQRLHRKRQSDREKDYDHRRHQEHSAGIPRRSHCKGLRRIPENENPGMV